MQVDTIDPNDIRIRNRKDEFDQDLNEGDNKSRKSGFNAS
jgi:hypothetical protein